MPFAGGFIFIKPSPVSSKLPISPACGDPSPLLPVLFGQAVKTSAVPSVSAISAVVMSAVPVLLNSRFFQRRMPPFRNYTFAQSFSLLSYTSPVRLTALFYTALDGI